MRSLLRVGAVDEAVPPYHVRRIARLLEGCPASEYEEVPSKGHWWWDTTVANDGGTVNDERLRKFFAEAFSSRDECPVGYEHVTTNVDAVLGSCGFRVEQQVVKRQIVAVEAVDILGGKAVAREQRIALGQHRLEPARKAGRDRA